MKSPFTGGEVSLVKEWQTVEYRKDTFNVFYHSYVCIDTAQHFTNDELDGLNLSQVHNQYRAKYGIPFIDEIKNVRKKYDLSAAKMSEVLGFGTNIYRNYEAGEMPSVANGRLIRMAEDVEEFRKLLHLSKNSLEPHEYERVLKKIEHARSGWKAVTDHWEKMLFGNMMPDIYNGYRVPSIQKIGAIVNYFASNNKPYTTALNKLLFYADFGHFKNYGCSISGLSYNAITNGPVPMNYGGIYNKVANDGYTVIIEQDFDDFVGEQFTAGRDFDSISESEELLSELEKETLKKVATKFKGMSTKKIVDLSHAERAWQDNVDDYGRINYKYGFDLKHFD